jgi:hypothetical protein
MLHFVGWKGTVFYILQPISSDRFVNVCNVSSQVRMPSVGKMRSGVSIRDDFVGFSLEWLSAVSVFRKPGTQTEVNPNVARVCSSERNC